jgi:outer membrane receptor for ferrienterochelin and colicins
VKRSSWVACTLLLVPALASAQSPAAVDVADLPPLPPASEAQSSSATVLAASAADEDVVVGAAKREQTLGNVASAVTVVTADRIRRFGYRTVAEAISGVAGIFTQDNRLTTQIGVRGVQIEGGFNSRILILVDGATINEAWGAFAGVGIDGLISIDDIARIEVIRGPVGAVYGTNAFFAILNIVTRGVAEGQRAWGRVGVNSVFGAVTTAGFAAGSVDQQIRGSVMFNERFGDTTSVPEIGDGLDADGGRTIIGSLVGTYNGSFAQLRAYRARRDNPFGPYDSDPELDPAYALYNYQVLLEGGHSRELTERLTGSVRVYGGAYRFYDEINYAVDDQFVDYGDALTAGAEVRGRYEIIDGDKLGATLGAEANYNKTESRSYTVGEEDDAAIVPLDFNVVGTYAEIDGAPTKWLGFTAGIRYDRNSVIDQRVSPRGALFLAKEEQVGLKLLYAEGFRNPSAFEGFFEDGVDFSSNPNIKSESIRSFEAVLWARPIAGLSTRLSGFYWTTDNIVEQREDPDMAGLLQFQNVGQYVTRGIEAEFTYRNSAGWYAFGGAAFASVGFGEEGEEIVYGDVINAPAVTATGGISTPKIGGYAHLSVEGQYLGERATRDPMVKSPGWFGLNAAVYVPDIKKFDVTIGARNLLNKRDLMPAPGDYDLHPDENDPTITTVVPRIPGEGLELYVKVGYTY